MRPWEKKKYGQDLGSRTIRPTHNRLLVTVERPPQYTGVIFVVGDTGEDRAVVRGKIVSVGPGKAHEKTGELVPINEELKPGVRIIYGKYAGTEVIIDGIDHRIIPETDVLGLEEDVEVFEKDCYESWEETQHENTDLT